MLNPTNKRDASANKLASVWQIKEILRYAQYDKKVGCHSEPACGRQA
ncbi:MAG: hypothetical protein ACLGGV_04735 [Bacteroidia bacterium]